MLPCGNFIAGEGRLRAFYAFVAKIRIPVDDLDPSGVLISSIKSHSTTMVDAQVRPTADRILKRDGFRMNIAL
jgi:hypothetical protein